MPNEVILQIINALSKAGPEYVERYIIKEAKDILIHMPDVALIGTKGEIAMRNNQYTIDPQKRASGVANVKLTQKEIQALLIGIEAALTSSTISAGCPIREWEKKLIRLQKLRDRLKSIRRA